MSTLNQLFILFQIPNLNCFQKKLVFAFYLHSFAFYNKLFTSLLSFILLESNYLPLYLRFTITTNWTTITTLEVVHCPRFEYSIFTLHRPPEGCRGVLRSTFWRNFYDMVSAVIDFLDHIQVWCRLSWARPLAELEVVQEVYH